MRYAFILLVLALSGCTTLSEDTAGVLSLTNAGLSSFTEKVVVVPEGSVVGGIERTIVLGRGVKRVELELSYDANGKPKVKIIANGVTAFEGQASAQTALVQARKALTQQNIEQANIGAATAVDAIDVALKAMVLVP